MQGYLWFLVSEKVELKADPLPTKLLSYGIRSQHGFGKQTLSPYLKVILKPSSLIKLNIRAGLLSTSPPASGAVGQLPPLIYHQSAFWPETVY